jgi:hypothetical protein
MSLKLQNLGAAAAVAAGILITGGTNATPIVATITAGHGLKDGDRIVISGVTGLTAMNGEWELKFTAATTAQLLGSSGNGAFGGTAAVAVLCDKTPFMPRTSVVGLIGASGTGITVAPIATALIESSSDNVTFASAIASGHEVINAITAPASFMREVKLDKYMRLRLSAWTSGSIAAGLLA